MRAQNGTVAMHMAAMQGHADTIKMLLELGQDVNALDVSARARLSASAAQACGPDAER